MKTCRLCGRELDESYFSIRGKYIATGDIMYRSECKFCENERNRTKYKRRMDLLRQHKTKCRKCGNPKWYLLEFHKREPDDINIPKNFWANGPIDKVMEELPKHDALCANCRAAFEYLKKTYNMSYEFYLSNDCNHYL